jgi:hypothetical protein
VTFPVVLAENGDLSVVDKGQRNGAFIGARQIAPDEPVPLGDRRGRPLRIDGPCPLALDSTWIPLRR